MILMTLYYLSSEINFNVFYPCNKLRLNFPFHTLNVLRKSLHINFISDNKLFTTYTSAAINRLKRICHLMYFEIDIMNFENGNLEKHINVDLTQKCSDT